MRERVRNGETRQGEGAGGRREGVTSQNFQVLTSLRCVSVCVLCWEGKRGRESIP